MKRLFMLLVFSLLCGIIYAQDAETIYKDGKTLYDAKKYKEAFAKFQTSANQGYKKAQYYLGRCYDKGHGITENDQQAVFWYEKAAAQNHPKAQYELGKCYKKGEGVTKDLDKAFQYFEKSAAQDNADAQFELGKCYMKGKGTAENLDKAKTLFNQSVNNPKGGDKVLKKLKKDAAEGDETSKKILKMLKN